MQSKCQGHITILGSGAAFEAVVPAHCLRAAEYCVGRNCGLKCLRNSLSASQAGETSASNQTAPTVGYCTADSGTAGGKMGGAGRLTKNSMHDCNYTAEQ